jgi:hypothetical protein
MGKAGQVIAGVVLVLTFLGGLYVFVVGVAGAQDTSRDLILNTDQSTAPPPVEELKADAKKPHGKKPRRRGGAK